MVRCSALHRLSPSSLAALALAATRASLSGRLARASARRGAGDGDRGDVPGWVLVTIMTAGLVVALWAIAGPKLAQLFTDAMDSVTAP
jgi:hypothetical protein